MSSKIKFSPIKTALTSLTEALSEREKELDTREEKLEQYQKRLEEDHSLHYGETSPADVLHLNVGGTKTTVLRRTLTSVPGSMLASRFSGRWDDSIEKDKDGDFFLDQEFSLFNHVLTYLRNKANGAEKYPIKSPHIENYKRNDFYRMVEYYGLTNGIYPTKLIAFHPSDSLEMLGSKKVKANRWATFELALDGHGRKVKTFEVTLGDVQRIQIGWVHTSSYSKPTNDDLGVGEIGGTNALDLTQSSFLVSTSISSSYSSRSSFPSSSSSSHSYSIEGLEHPEGTVVLSENYGIYWYVNGNLVYDASQETYMNDDRTYCKPLISVKGEIEITSVELDD